MMSEMPNDLSPVELQRLSSSVKILDNAAARIAYQHTVFCQTCLPYRNPGNIRIWGAQPGRSFLRVDAGAVRQNSKLVADLETAERGRQLLQTSLNRVEAERDRLQTALTVANPRPDAELLATFPAGDASIGITLCGALLQKSAW